MLYAYNINYVLNILYFTLYVLIIILYLPYINFLCTN